MRIYSNAYQLLYKVLRDKFVEKEWNGKAPASKRADTPSIWDKKDPDGTSRAHNLFSGTRTGDQRYIYRKSIELHPKKTEAGTFDRIALLRVLLYILGVKYEYDTLKKKDESYYPEQIQNRWDELKKAYPDVFQSDMQLIEKGENFDSLTKQHIMTNKPQSFYPESQSSQEYSAKSVVQEFYERLGGSDFNGAWNLMAPEFQNKRPWNGDYEKFRIGYTNTNGIRNIVIFHTVQEIPNVVNCRVFYDDEVAAYSTKELRSLEILTVGDLDFFVEQIKNLKNNFESKGLKNFDKIELQKLFEPSASEYIWYKCGYDPSELHELFTTQRAIIVRRVYDCCCKYYENNGWLISKINTIKTFSAR